MNIEVIELSSCPEHLETIGAWIYNEWWRTKIKGEDFLEILRKHTEKGSFPFTIVAIEDEVPVGSCCVIENDCELRPQYTPWVAAVFVKPERRCYGIASRILQEAIRVAKNQGINGLYIDCWAKTAHVYEKNGWAIFEKDVGQKDSLIMYQRISNEP